MIDTFLRRPKGYPHVIKRLRTLPPVFLYGLFVTLLTVMVVVISGAILQVALRGQGRSLGFGTTVTRSTAMGSTAIPTATPIILPTGTITKLPSNLSDTSSNIHLGLSFDSYISNFASLNHTIDVVWAAKNAASVPGAFTVSYNPSERIGNAATGPLYSFDWFVQNHPDWIIYKCNRATPAFGFGEANTPLDITNVDVLQFLLTQQFVPQINAGYKGIGIDNVGFQNQWGRCGHFDKTNTWVPLYTGLYEDPAYQQSILTWAQRIYAIIKNANPHVAVVMNISFDQSHSTLWSQMLPNMDLLVDEAGFSNFGDANFPYATDGSWLSHYTFLQQFQQSSGNGVFIINQVPNNIVTSSQLQWALANYLLIKGQHSYITVVGKQQYGQFFDHPEYHILIGQPLNYTTTDGCIYQRNYSNGIVLVNPSSQVSCAVTFSQPYKTSAGISIYSTTVPPHTGVTLFISP